MIKDPSGRFERRKEVLTSSRRMSCFSGYDNELGLEISWHELNINSYSKEEIEIICNNLDHLKSIMHPNILTLITYWKTESIIFYITESIYSDSIWERIVNGQISPRPRVLAKWLMSILQALDYLHQKHIVHGNINLHWVFTKPSTGQIKLLPPTFLPIRKTNTLKLRFYTPPDSLFGSTSCSSDIWMLGILAIQAFTQEQPYSECDSPITLYQALRESNPPEALKHVSDPLLINFIRSCFRPQRQRPSPSELLRHPYFEQHFEVHNTPLGNGGKVSVLLTNRNFSTEVLMPERPRNQETSSSPIMLSGHKR